MKGILENGVRQALRGLFGPGVEAFVLDDDWQALLFVPELSAEAGDDHCMTPAVTGSFTLR